MLPGNHFTRTTYGPGLLGSPKSTADSFVPAAFLTHLISDGVLKSTGPRGPWGFESLALRHITIWRVFAGLSRWFGPSRWLVRRCSIRPCGSEATPTGFVVSFHLNSVS